LSDDKSVVRLAVEFFHKGILWRKCLYIPWFWTIFSI